MNATAWADGGNRKTISGCGVYIKTAAGEIVQISKVLPIGTNNVAEYFGLISALEWAVAHSVQTFEVIMDSEVVARQILGIYECRAPHLKPLYEAAMELIWQIPNFTIRNVPREENEEADRLSNEAMNRGTTNVTIHHESSAETDSADSYEAEPESLRG